MTMDSRRIPILIYDGDCGFCTSAVRLVERRLRPRCTIEPWQVTDLRSLGIPRQRAASEVLWVTPSGEVHRGAQAVAELLLHTGRLWHDVGALMGRPPVSWLASGVYTVVAGNRGRLPGGTPACALPPEQRPGVISAQTTRRSSRILECVRPSPRHSAVRAGGRDGFRNRRRQAGIRRADM